MGVSWSRNETSCEQVQPNGAELLDKLERKTDYHNQSTESEPSQHNHGGNRRQQQEDATCQHSNIDKSPTDDDRTTWQKNLLEKLYTCPICMDLLYPYVIQCDNAHAVCSSCAAKLDVCPYCRGEPPYWRNLWMEKLAERLRWPCRNAWRGCQEIVPAPQWHEHADCCAHSPPPVDEEEHGRKIEEFETWLERREAEELE